MLGPHEIDVTYEGLPIPGSPYEVNAVPGNDPTRVKAYGPGLEKGTTNEPQKFTIETKGAGQGGLALAIEGLQHNILNIKIVFFCATMTFGFYKLL